MPEQSLNVLFTSVGRRVELLRAFRKAFEGLSLDGRIIGTDIDPLAPAIQETDSWYVVPRYESADYVPALHRICQINDIRLIFPLIDPDIEVLAANRQALESTGAQVVVVSSNAVDIAADKWRTTKFFRQAGVLAPESWLPEDVTSRDLPFPVVVKPRRGSAGEGVFKVRDQQELEFFLRYVEDPMIQELLPGPELTNDVVCGITGNRVLGVISRRRIEVRWGEVAKGVTVRRTDVEEACVRIAKALPGVGPLTVQCMMKDDQPHFTEINARFGGGVPLGIAAGVRAPEWLLAEASGRSVEVPALGTYKEGLYMTRFDDSFFLTEDELERIQRNRL